MGTSPRSDLGGFPAVSLKPAEIAKLLAPYLSGPAYGLQAECEVASTAGCQPSLKMFEQLEVYLELIMRWNARTNLTAIRRRDEIVSRHFGESLFLGRHLAAERCLLDLGSGAGFPGIPVQILRPDLTIVLAESQNKKASFLREVIRVLELPTDVWGGRAEEIGSLYSFDAVMLRAVDHSADALNLAARLAADLYLLSSKNRSEFLSGDGTLLRIVRRTPVPDGSTRTLLHLSTQ